MRALGGGAHFARGEWADAACVFETCGGDRPACCACVVYSWVRVYAVGRLGGGRDAFARCVALDEEEAESWNNLARMYLRMGGAKAGGWCCPCRRR